jgi:Tfp pilus assembly protein PilV
MKHPQRGITLIEALIAFLVLSLGMLAVVRMQPELRQHAELARQRSEATRIAQQDIEALRGMAAASFEEIASATYTVEPDGLGSPPYTVQRRVDAAAWPRARSVEVVVRWPDRSGEDQQVALATLIGASDPSTAGAMLLAR